MKITKINSFEDIVRKVKKDDNNEILCFFKIIYDCCNSLSIIILCDNKVKDNIGLLSDKSGFVSLDMIKSKNILDFEDSKSCIDFIMDYIGTSESYLSLYLDNYFSIETDYAGRKELKSIFRYFDDETESFNSIFVNDTTMLFKSRNYINKDFVEIPYIEGFDTSQFEEYMECYDHNKELYNDMVPNKHKFKLRISIHETCPEKIRLHTFNLISNSLIDIFNSNNPYIDYTSLKVSDARYIEFESCVCPIIRVTKVNKSEIL